MLVARRTLLRSLVAVGDAATITAAFGCAYVIVGRLFDRHFGSFDAYAWLLVVIIPVWLACLRVFGLYMSALYTRPRSLVANLLEAHLLASLLFLSVMYLTKSVEISRLLVQAFVVTGFSALMLQKLAVKAILEYLRNHDLATRRRVLIVASSERAMNYVEFVKAHTSMNAEIIGYLDPGILSERDIGHD